MQFRPQFARRSPGLLAAALVVLAACSFSAQTPTRIISGIDWSGRGVWLKADLHTHTRFSDGSHSVDEVVGAAAKHGCDVLAITDHADGDLRAATPEYLDAIRTARLQNPAITIVTGMEWNVPPGKGQEHATILFPTAMETLDTLASFKDRFDDENKEGENPELAVRALAALAPKDRSVVSPVVFFNHPSRSPNSTSAPALTFDVLKRAAPSLLIGFEGAPGHQRGAPSGAYPASVMLVDRWDPLAANPDGLWDQWLRKGVDVWAAIADSDFHNERDDFWPGEFAATWLYAPDRTVDGVIRALRAGSFFAEHGHIVSEVELLARVDGQPKPIVAGETVSTRAGAQATVSLEMKVPATDYLTRENRIDKVELIGISQTKTEVLFSGPPGNPAAFKTLVTVPSGGIILRARGRRTIDDEPALMFYTNPIRISAPSR